ncbi:hypothetical protein GCM10023191_023040 [Actinoallomurus oryzae]|uniref:Integrase n=1 Tax=Actinoallomurus oryzae TaxID=502180 RepID=A0ABP8PSZ9_9ACTN
MLRHQLTILQRQSAKPAFTPADRFLLTGLLHRLPTDKLRQLHLLVRPDTILHWHRRALTGPILRRFAGECPRPVGRKLNTTDGSPRAPDYRLRFADLRKLKGGPIASGLITVG